MSGGAPPPPAAPRRALSGWSRAVRWLKIALPLAGLVLLALLFLIPRETRFDGGLVYTSADLLALGEGLAVSRPRIAGATAAGEPFTVEADQAVPDGPDPERVTLEVVRAELIQADGREVRLAAQAGRLAPKAQTLGLEGAVRVTTSDGWRVETEAVEADLRAGEMTAPGPVTAEGPAGRLDAGSFRARRIGPREAALGGPAAGDYLWFEGGVRVIWTPPPSD